MIFAELSSTHPEKKEAMIILMLVMLRLVQELNFIHSHNVTMSRLGNANFLTQTCDKQI